MDFVEDIKKKYLRLLNECLDLKDLEDLKVSILGKKGTLTLKMRELGTMSSNDRLVLGPALNSLKKQILDEINIKKELFHKELIEKKILSENIDISIPSRKTNLGTIHPISQVNEEIITIFSDLGFLVADGPQVESDWYNFDALNIPPEHPARQEFDTFYIKNDQDTSQNSNVLRTHTSPVQIRYMEEFGIPCKIISPGRVFRSDYDQTHTPMFHQVEGLAIGKDISMANLKWVLEEFCKAFFEIENVELRFRSSHFPFTEPSAEVDIRCSWLDKKLVIGKGDEWMEILGSGMVHPNVLKSVKVDPKKYQGFAFGLGIDRLAMLKYGIPDLRNFFDSDIRWLKHYGFNFFDVPSIHSGISNT